MFVLMEGQGLSAQMVGGYHGNADDDDVDMAVYSRKGGGFDDMNTWCSDLGVSMGSFGFKDLDPSKSFKAMMRTPLRFGLPANHSKCIANWEGIDVLIPHPDGHYFRTLNGGSYWVPPVQGGKHMGSKFEDYINPDKSHFLWFQWLVNFHDGLRGVVDVDSNGPVKRSKSACSMFWAPYIML